jgi:hypothetical protein
MSIPGFYKERNVIGQGKHLIQRVHFHTEGITEKHTKNLWGLFRFIGTSSLFLGLEIEVKIKPIGK